MLAIPPSVTYVESFTVMGLSTRTKNSDEFNEKTAKLPNLWQQFYSSELATQANIYEVYSEYESNADGFYTVTVGIAGENERVEFSSVKIKAGNYLVFHGAGPMPLTVVETWKQIWSYFTAESEYQRSFISDFEAYSGHDKVDIYIGIK